ncbi:MAG: hypothetical protein Q4B42_00555, partial [Oscillospiraceae bacterium]|nr:hypothetical protein [Oscillospiraceae bacterium]
EYISGRGLTEPFTDADDPSHGYVEMLEINADGSFTLTHLLPDARDEDGYLDGSWPIDSVLSGEVEVYVENQCLLFKYSEFGQDYYIDRYIIETGDGSLTLREFYTDDMSESFDMVYRRIDGETAAVPEDSSVEASADSEAAEAV